MYFAPFLFSFLVSLAGVWIIRKLKGELSRFGGLAIISGFIIAILLNNDLVLDWQKIGILVSSVLILIYGLVDDIFNLSWKKQLVFQFFIVTLVIFSGIAVDYLTNPFLESGVLRLDIIKFSIGNFDISLFGSIFISFWLLFLINAMNWIDGIDGLAGSVSTVSFVALFFLSVSSIVNQPQKQKLADISGNPPQSGKYIEVDIGKMTITANENKNKVLSYAVAGIGNPAASPTPIGQFKVLSKEEKHFSSLSKVWMPWSVRFNGPYFLHGIPYWPNGEKLNTRYSGGCVRLPEEVDKAIYDFAEVGTPIIVYKSKNEVSIR